MVAPELAEAPVMLPVTVPIVHEKLLGAVAVKPTLGAVPLQILAVFGVVTSGTGYTVTVIIEDPPAHVPDVPVGVTIYSTVPATALLGLVNV
jgi:hypothetical protein